MVLAIITGVVNYSLVGMQRRWFANRLGGDPRRNYLSVYWFSVNFKCYLIYIFGYLFSLHKVLF